MANQSDIISLIGCAKHPKNLVRSGRTAYARGINSILSISKKTGVRSIRSFSQFVLIMKCWMHNVTIWIDESAREHHQWIYLRVVVVAYIVRLSMHLTSTKRNKSSDWLFVCRKCIITLEDAQQNRSETVQHHLKISAVMEVMYNKFNVL